MEKIFRRGLLILLIGSCCSWVHGDPAELESVREKYRTMHARVGDDYSAAVVAAVARYGQSLGELVKKYQAQGELEAVLSLMAEKKRFDAEGTVPKTPPASAHETLRKLSLAYQAALNAADDKRAATLPVLLESYLKKLDDMKRQYTREGKLEEALAVKSEVQRVGKRHDSIVIKGVNTSKPAPRTEAPRTGGTFVPPQSSVNTSVNTPAPSVDPRRAFLERKKKEQEERMRSTTHRRRPSESLDAGMDKYRESMGVMAEEFRKGESEIVDFNLVQSNPDAYKGRVLRSGVYVKSAFARGVTVSHKASGAASLEMIPHSMPIGKAASDVFRGIGSGGMAVVTYGVVNEKNFTLFGMDPL